VKGKKNKSQKCDHDVISKFIILKEERHG